MCNGLTGTLKTVLYCRGLWKDRISQEFPMFKLANKKQVKLDCKTRRIYVWMRFENKRQFI
jgi:hypothetical protein